MSETPAIRAADSGMRPGPGRLRLVAGAVLALPCWFCALVLAYLSNDIYTNCAVDCEYPNHRAGAVGAVFEFLLALVPIAVAGLWRRSSRWRLVGIVLAVLAAVSVTLLVTKRPPNYGPLNLPQ